MRRLAAFFLALGMISMGGCGLSDDLRANQAKFDLDAEFEISTSNASWRVPPPGGVPSWVCDGRAALVSDCCHTPTGDDFDCGQYPLRCDLDGFCALAFEYESAQTVDLAVVPELDAFRGRAMTAATLKQFNLAGEVVLPVRTMDLYVAPKGNRSTDPAAVYLASFGSPGHRSVTLSDGARVALSSFLVDIQAPFDVILVSHVVVPRAQAGAGGSQSMKVTVSGQVVADF